MFFGPYCVSSEVGPQQGDPIGPLLFCNTIHPLLSSLNSNLNLGYLDDLTLGGSVAAVARDVTKIVDEGGNLGLTLNVSKCELVAHPGFSVADNFLQRFTRVDVPDAILLGAPLFSGPALDKAWADRCADLTRAVARLHLVGAQESLILMRASFSSPKVLHLLRCSPSVSHPALSDFDSLLRTAIEQITNSSLTDSQWLQASLPIREGGLGIRRVSSLALPAFLASAASTVSLQDAILAKCQLSECSFFSQYFQFWSSAYGLAPNPLPPKQSFWDRPGVLLDRAGVESSFTNPFQRASFLAAASRHSGDWLFALPIASCGLKLDDEAVRVAVGLRLGTDLCVPHQCQCGAQVDARGLHSLVCKQAPGRSARHHALNDVVARAFSSAGVPVIKEPVGLYRTDGKRPDGLTLIPWQAGKSAVWDVTVTCTTASSYIAASAREAGAAAELAASRKTAKYSSLATQYIFYPVAVETHGPLNEEARQLLSDLGRRASASSGDVREVSFLFQRISVVVQRFNSVLLHDGFLVDGRSE